MLLGKSFCRVNSFAWKKPGLQLRRMSASVFKSVAISGGTHGNEKIGIEMVRLFGAAPSLVERKGLEVKVLMANKKAVEVNKRYTEIDLNRCFSKQGLESDTPKEFYEQRLAAEINDLLGPKGDSTKTDYIIDLHNTTSRTGVLLCFHRHDKISLEIGAYLSSVFDDISLHFWQNENVSDIPFLPSIAKAGMTVEVGPLAHGSFSIPIFERTRDVVYSILDYIEAKNSNKTIMKKVDVEIGKRVAIVKFPRDKKGNISAYVNQPVVVGDLDSQEFTSGRKITPKMAFFKATNGETFRLNYEELGLKLEDFNSGIYASFVNEASYYEKDVACYLAAKENHSVEILDLGFHNKSAKL